MRTGIEEIIEERRHQLEDLGYTALQDVKWERTSGEFADAISYCLALATGADSDMWPWPEKAPTISTHSPIQLFAITGALSAAAIDHINQTGDRT